MINAGFWVGPNAAWNQAKAQKRPQPPIAARQHRKRKHAAAAAGGGAQQRWLHRQARSDSATTHEEEAAGSPRPQPDCPASLCSCFLRYPDAPAPPALRMT
eukprot:COSAG01_NODE_1672_length_9554_cov_4.065785_10_plen_101_part_00